MDVNLIHLWHEEDRQLKEYLMLTETEWLKHLRTQGNTMDIDSIHFDEADDVSFWATDIGRVRRREARKPEPKPVAATKKIEAPPFLDSTNEVRKELTALKKQLEKQASFLKELAPVIDRVDHVFKDALVRMEKDSFDDVYGISEMQSEFKKLNTLIAKIIPKEEVKFDPNGIKIVTHTEEINW